MGNAVSLIGRGSSQRVAGLAAWQPFGVSMAPMNAPPKFSIIDQIRTRDGDECWLCGGKLDFRAAPNSTKAPTKEHLVAQSLGGGNELANLVLCHPGCNKHLGDRPIEKKREMREKIRANRARVAVKRVASTHSRPVAV
jgi:hypothetical protein